MRHIKFYEERDWEGGDPISSKKSKIINNIIKEIQDHQGGLCLHQGPSTPTSNYYQLIIIIIIIIATIKGSAPVLNSLMEYLLIA